LQIVPYSSNAYSIPFISARSPYPYWIAGKNRLGFLMQQKAVTPRNSA
jgi:hypothetical protein